MAAPASTRRGAAVLATLALALAMSSAGMVPTVHAESFAPYRTYVLDHDAPTGNLLVRGNNPRLANGSFAWAELVDAIGDAAKNASVPMPTTFKVVDVSMLVGLDPKESKDLKNEQDFFKANPDKGTIINWPLLTDLLGPCWVSASTRVKDATSGHWDTDDVVGKSKQLRSMLTTPGAGLFPADDGTATIVYIHCEAGVDRTGEMAGSYLMQYHNQTYQQVLTFDNSVEPRAISSEAENGLQWFALYVQYALGGAATFSC